VTADVVALTAQGRLRGAADDRALRFLGVPYAESPATAGRFGAPAPPGHWDGIRDALCYGATSPQPDRGITLIPEPIIVGDNELNLKVFTPDPGAARLPVLVWIHGGGFFAGCNASPWYRGGPFARDGVVLVSINYRLGAEGFLEVPGAPANRGHRPRVQYGLDTSGLDNRGHGGRRAGQGGRPGAAGRRVPQPRRTAPGRCRGAGRHRPDIPRSGPAAGRGQGGGGRPGLQLRLPLGRREAVEVLIHPRPAGAVVEDEAVAVGNR
jgi:hypothetical protein